MRNDDFYTQCRFRKAIPFTGCFGPPQYEYTQAYIPTWAAKVGNEVELVSLDGQFWEVTEAGGTSFPKEFIKENERNYKLYQESLKGGGIDQ